MSDYPPEEAEVDDAPATTEGLDADVSDDFDGDLGDAAKGSHVAPILPPK